jgi:hypothetical protein
MRLLREKKVEGSIDSSTTDYDIVALSNMLEVFAQDESSSEKKSMSMVRQGATLSPSEIDRSFFQQEAKRISVSAAVEQQKHDLTLKMQQVRERQKLNQKLMQRRISKSRESSFNSAGAKKSSQSPTNSFQSTSPSQQQLQNQQSMRGMQSRGLSLAPLLRK